MLDSSTSAPLFSETLSVARASGNGTLEYRFVLAANEGLCLEVLDNLDDSGNSAGGLFTQDPVPIARALRVARGDQTSSNNNDKAFWEVILAEHQLLL